MKRRLIELYYDATDSGIWLVGRVRCALFGAYTVACRGRQACWHKHSGVKA